jgi:hypothetical protein
MLNVKKTSEKKSSSIPTKVPYPSNGTPFETQLNI